jgi:hypothetical protein
MKKITIEVDENMAVFPDVITEDPKTHAIQRYAHFSIPIPGRKHAGITVVIADELIEGDPSAMISVFPEMVSAVIKGYLEEYMSRYTKKKGKK